MGRIDEVFSAQVSRKIISLGRYIENVSIFYYGLMMPGFLVFYLERVRPTTAIKKLFIETFLL